MRFYFKNNIENYNVFLKFMNFRRPSDTTSDSGSDDFKLEPLDVEISSSFSRSSSESCHSATLGVANSSRYQCSGW